jgi:hypothetical protein
MENRLRILSDTKLKIREQITVAIEQALKELLQDKHLYQSITPAFEENQPNQLAPHLSPIDRTMINNEGLSLRFGPWTPFDPKLSAPVKSGESLPDLIRFLMPTIKVYCETCDSKEAFNPVGFGTAPSFETLFAVSREGVHKLLQSFTPGKALTQVFVFSYQCQHCKGAPDVFLVRRLGTKLTLSGRSPMENVEVPKYIPRPESRWYSGAIVAYQSGQELAGLFLLRTLLEQFARRATGSKALRGGDVITAYMETLPEAVKSSFPSPANLYEEISGALHAADSALSPFPEVKKGIDEHFDARRLFKL